MATSRGRGLLLRCALYVAAAALAAVAHACTAIEISQVELEEDGARREVELPFSEPETTGDLVFRMNLRAGKFGQRSILIIPDDHFVSLSLNGQRVSLTRISNDSLNDYRRGFVLRLPPLRAGDNHLEATIRNGGGPGGLDLRPSPVDWTNLVEVSMATLALAAMVVEFMRRRASSGLSRSVAVAAIAVRVAYLLVTPSGIREHDAARHVEYVEYLMTHHALPAPNDGYAFYHPPLYYVLGALQWTALAAMGLSRPSILLSLQLQSMLFELGFALLSLATARLFLDALPDAAFGRWLTSRTGLTGLLAALILLWPSSVIHSVRIGNDDLAYLFFAGGLYLVSRWWRGGAERDLRWAALVGAFGVVTKTNDVLLFAVLFTLVAARVVFAGEHVARPFLARVRQGFTRAWLPALIFALSVAAALGTAIRDKLAGHRAHLLVGNADRNTPLLLVGDHVKNFVWFDAWTFVSKPFTSPMDDALGRQWFWNYTLKTCLWGEFSFAGAWQRALATTASSLLLLMLAALIVGAALRKPRAWLRDLPLPLTVVFLVSSLAALRASIPMACSGDFRYVLPVLGPCAFGYVSALVQSRARGWRVVAVAGAVVAWASVAVSVAFLLGLPFSEG